MKEIVLYVKEFVAEQWNPAYFLWVGTLLSGLFFVNYRFGFETTITRSLSFPIGHITFYFTFYFVPYLLTHAAYALVRKEQEIFRNRRFWALSVFAFVVLAVYVTLHDGPAHLLKTQSSLFKAIDMQLRPIVSRCAGNIIPPTFLAVPLLLYWWISDRTTMPPYGFSAKTINLTPYVLLLLFLAPLIAGVSLTPDFQHAYPRFKFGFPDHLAAGERRMMIGLFELCYGTDFVFVEFFFRGFMILAFARMLGSRAIIPMVVVYALIHFEKPLLEALSSIIGGLVLGVISYRTKSIYGGIILHLGIAFMMEIAGAIQIMSR